MNERRRTSGAEPTCQQHRLLRVSGERYELPQRDSGAEPRPPKGFPLFSALRMASPDTIILWTIMQPLGARPRTPHLVYASESYSPGADDATSAMGNPPLFRNAAVTPATATAQLPCAFRAIAIPIRGCTVAIKVESQSRRSCNRRTAAATDSSERKATRSVRHVPRISRTRRTTSEC